MILSSSRIFDNMLIYTNWKNLVFVLFGISLGFILIGETVFALIAILSVAAFCIAVVQPSLLIIGYFLYLPFTEYVRYLFPAEITIGGRDFILSGAVKESLLFLAIGSFLCRKFILKIGYRNKNVTYYLILLLLTYLFINIFRNDNPTDGLWGFRNYFYSFVFYFIGFYFIHDNNTAMWIIRAFLLSGLVLVVVALIQIFIDPYFLVSPEVLTGKIQEFMGIQRVTSLLANPNHLGRILVTAILLACTIFLYCRSKVEKLFLIILFLGSNVAFFYTLSRESFLALVIGMLILSIVSIENNNYIKLLPVILGLILILPLIPSYFYERLDSISLSGAASRIIMWKTIIVNLSNDIIFGKGTGSIGTFGLNEIILKGTPYSCTDNGYLTVLVEAGIIGLLLFLMMLFFIGRNLLVSLVKTDERFLKMLSLGTLVSFSSLIVTNFFAESMYAPESSFVWLLIGCVGGHISASPKTAIISQST